MRMLLIHNKYKLPGGEDGVFNTEGELLEKNGHEVERIVFDNTEIRSFWDKCASGLGLLYNSKSAKIISRKIEEFRPDIIHVHNIVPLVSPSVFFVARRYGIPVVLTLHNYRMVCPSATLFHKNFIYEKSLQSLFPFDAIIKGVYRDSVVETAILAFATGLHHALGTWRNKVDFYISLTAFAKEKFTTARVPLPSSKVLVKPNSVEDHGVGPEFRRDHFLFVGRLVEEKGLRVLLQATWLSHFRLIIIGEGPMEQEVIEHTKKNPNVVYLGKQDKATVISHMKTSRALIFPSLWYEGLPLTLLEAFSAGTPVIASSIGAMKELIQHGVNGLLFEPGRERDLVDRIEDIMYDRVNVPAISEKARASYLRYFTPQRNYNMLLTIYNRAIAMKLESKSKWRGKMVHEMRGATS